MEDARIPAFATAAIEGGDQAEEIGEQLGVDALGMCPEAITEMFLVALESEGLELTAEAEVCLTSEIQKRGRGIGEEFFAASDDSEASSRLGEEIVTPCRDLIRG